MLKYQTTFHFFLIQLLYDKARGGKSVSTIKQNKQTKNSRLNISCGNQDLRKNLTLSALGHNLPGIFTSMVQQTIPDFLVLICLKLWQPSLTSSFYFWTVLSFCLSGNTRVSLFSYNSAYYLLRYKISVKIYTLA